MARVFYQFLIGSSETLILNPSSSSLHLSGALRSSNFLSSARLIAFRLRSHRADRGHLVEIDLGASDSASSSASSGDAEVVGVRRLEDFIHRIIVRRSAPDWLPFLPGSSYWIPPRRRAAAAGMAGLVGRFANPMSEEEMLSLTTARGWPSSAYFGEGASPHPEKDSPKKSVVQSDDEDEE